jgi:hypothetical protein
MARTGSAAAAAAASAAAGNGDASPDAETLEHLPLLADLLGAIHYECSVTCNV